MTALDIFVYFIFFIKIVFLILIIVGKVTLHKKNEATYEKVMKWKDKFENIFLLCVSLLCIYIFFPRRKIPLVISKETQFLLFVYGIVVLIELISDSAFVQKRKENNKK